MDPWFSKSKNFLGRWIFAATKVKRKKRKKLTGGRNSKKVLLTPTYNLPLNEVLGIKVTQPLDIFFSEVPATVKTHLSIFNEMSC
jgi:hypothetical protein